MSLLATTKGFVFFVRSIHNNGYMLRSLVIRDLRARYVGSFLGFFWTIIHPISQIITYYFVFSVILKVRLGPECGDTSYVLWLMAGMFPWFLFTEVVMRSPTAVLDQADIITKTVFPSELLPLAHFMAAFVNHLIAMMVLLIILVASGHHLTLKILFTIPIIFVIGIFSIGISWSLSALNVFLRDIGQVLGVIVQIWFFITPILYPFHSIPEKLQKVFGLNPMLYVVEAYREAILGKSDLSAASFFTAAIPIFATFIIGGLIFRKLKPSFADIL